MLASTHCHWPQPVFRIRCTFFRYHGLLILAIPAGNVILNWPKLLRHFKNGFTTFFDAFVCHSTSLPVQVRQKGICTNKSFTNTANCHFLQIFKKHICTEFRSELFVCASNYSYILAPLSSEYNTVMSRPGYLHNQSYYCDV